MYERANAEMAYAFVVLCAIHGQTDLNILVGMMQYNDVVVHHINH